MITEELQNLIKIYEKAQKKGKKEKKGKKGGKKEKKGKAKLKKWCAHAPQSPTEERDRRREKSSLLDVTIS